MANSKFFNERENVEGGGKEVFAVRVVFWVNLGVDHGSIRGRTICASVKGYLELGNEM